jgi:hypothetical protein
MAAALTRQEEMFLDRIAFYLAQAGGYVSLTAIEAAGEKVLADDRRIVSRICSSDEFRAEAVTALSGQSYEAIQAAA